MKYIYLFLLSFLTIFDARAQSPGNNFPEHDAGYSRGLQDGLTVFEYINDFTGFTGKHFFAMASIGEVDLANGEVIHGINLRYDQYLGELLWLRHVDYKAGILPRKEITGFRLYPGADRQSLITFEKMDVDLPLVRGADAFVQVLVPGNPRLCVFRRSEISKEDNRKFVEEQYYFIESNGKKFALNLKKRSLLSIPVIDSKVMKGILRDYKLRVQNSEPAMIHAIINYNEKRDN
jgi:hypothetical protein